MTIPFSVGDLQVVPLSDGSVRINADFVQGADWVRHADLLDADGKLAQPVGTFAIRTAGEWLLVDAGVGPYDLPTSNAAFDAGHLPASLAEAGLRPADFSQVICTHLHPDHVGWLAVDGRPYFPHATVRFGQGDWDQFMTARQGPQYVRDILGVLAEQDRIVPIEADDTAIAPGVTSRATPGHSWGHTSYVLSSGGDRAILLGDSVLCPVQLEDADWTLANDVDPALASRTRDALRQELAGSATRAVAAHFPDLRAGRVLVTATSRRFA